MSITSCWTGYDNDNDDDNELLDKVTSDGSTADMGTVPGGSFTVLSKEELSKWYRYRQ